MVVVITTIVLGVYYLIFRNGSWVLDDNFILVLAHQRGFTLQWLETPVYQHWNPGMNAAFSAVAALFPIDYRWGLLLALIVLGAAILMFERAFSLIVPRRWGLIGLTSWFALSMLWTSPLAWWTFSVQVIPNILFDLVCLYGFLRFQRDGSTRWIALSAGALLLGLLFYEKTAFMLLYLALIRVLLMNVKFRPRALLWAFWLQRWLWLAYLAAVGLWAAAYRQFAGSPVDTHPSLAQYAGYFRLMWAHTLVPAMFGLRLPAAHLTMVQSAGLVAAQVGLAAIVIASAWRSPGALRAWIFFVIAVATTGVTVASSRVRQFGIDIGNDPRYLLDFTWIVPFAVTAAFRGGTITPLTARDASADAIAVSRRPGVWIVAGTVLLLAYAGASIATSMHLESAFPGLQARGWYLGIRESLARYDGSDQHPVIADEESPQEIVPTFNDPYSRLSEVLPLFAKVQVDGPMDGPLLSVSSIGVMQPARFRAQSTATLTQLLHAGGITSFARSSGPSCYYRASSAGGGIGGPVSATTVAPTSGPGTEYIVADYTSPTPFSAELYIDGGGGFIPLSQIKFAAGTGKTIAWLGYGTLHRYQINFPPSVRLCLRQISVGTLSG